MTDRGRYLELDGRPAVRFVRTYRHPVERVWAAVTEPDQLAKWFPSAVEFEPRVGGAVVFRGDPHMANAPGVVIGFDPPTHFAFSWGEDEVHLDLENVADNQCQLTLTDMLAEPNTAARNAAGWTVCLGELGKLIASEPSDGPHSAANMAQFAPTYDGYVAAGMPSGAPIPGTADGTTL
jgi:uncharacterized protein YndB with AHSA1/START domain